MKKDFIQISHHDGGMIWAVPDRWDAWRLKFDHDVGRREVYPRRIQAELVVPCSGRADPMLGGILARSGLGFKN